MVVPEVPGLLEDFDRKFPLQLSSQTHLLKLKIKKLLRKISSKNLSFGVKLSFK